jgi:methionyl aminopeptidase
MPASTPLRNTGQIKIHTQADFEGMRMVGRMAAQRWICSAGLSVPGVTTDLDDRAVEIIRDLGAVPAPLNYRGFHQIDMHLDQSCRVPRHSRR